MIVHEPNIVKEGDEICISSVFELSNPLPFLPKNLWYRFPEHLEKFIPPRADGFAATALMISMYSGEDLTIKGPISPKLAYNLLEYRQIFHAWLPKIFNLVDVKFDHLQAAPPVIDDGAVMTAFSGGIDSFYTLWSHLPENQSIKSSQITHGLFVHGLDPQFENLKDHQYSFNHYAEIFKSLNLELISARTNANQFAQYRISWIYFFGQPLIGAALLMNPLLKRFYMPSGFSYHNLEANGSSPIIDHLLSTESLDIIHHGASTSRIDKLDTLTKWPITHNNIRVCINKKGLPGLQNCSACDKCYRTITTLLLLEAMPQHSNFESSMSVWSYLKWGLGTTIYSSQAKQTQKLAIQKGKVGIAIMIQIAIWLGFVRRIVLDTFKMLLTQKQLYWLKRKIYSPNAKD